MNQLMSNRKVLVAFLVSVFVVSALLIAVPARANPGTLYVDVNQTSGDPNVLIPPGVCGGNTPCYSRMSAAITAASAGDTILVMPGTYNENPTISSSKANLIVQGQDKATTNIHVTGSYGVIIDASGVVFSGFTVKQNAAPTVQKGLGIGISASVTDVTVSDSIFDGTGSTKSGSMGLLVRKASRITIDNVESFGWTGYGIDVYSATTPQADDVTIKNSYFHDNGLFGVAVDRSTNVRVTNCIIGGPAGSGIAFFENAAYPVTGDEATENKIHGFTNNGILVVGDAVKIDGNEIYDSTNGIRITTNYWPYYTADNNMVTNNNIHDNGIGILIDGPEENEPTGNQIYCNSIVGNTEWGVKNEGATVVMATPNWWGDSTGPYHPTSWLYDSQVITNPGGKGDEVSDYVLYDPWKLGEVLVSIDIKPGSYPNSINLKSKGVVPVAVLTAGEFDASTVDPSTVKFAGASPVKWSLEDVNGDTKPDLVLHFKTEDLDLTSASTEAPLEGFTYDGIPIKGTDTVNMVPKK